MVTRWPSYQDLSPTTLHARCALRLITQALLERHIKFRWNFPFAFLVTHQDKTHTNTTPADVPDFQQALGLPPTKVEDFVYRAVHPNRCRKGPDSKEHQESSECRSSREPKPSLHPEIKRPEDCY
ncbi:Hypothetical predicted protein [Pelobates cultripes]|uniref:Uncharacterized protein n=1 Tax=Pelobates cultripes TaxID=61616 RepID=A0AAD1R4R7_PELCU|nr:Hypothetical predicted protein [Pelobates cultripes]